MAEFDKEELVAGALVKLGYKPGEAKAAAGKVKGWTRPLDQLLRDALAYARGDAPKKTKAETRPEERGELMRPAASASGTPRRWFPGLQKGWHQLSPATRNGLMWAAGGIVAGGTLAIVAGRAGRASSSASPMPAPGPSSAPASAPDAVLVVTTPGGAAQPGVLREAAGPNARRIDLLPYGTRVRVLGSVLLAGGARWYHVQPPPPRPSGWMHTAILRSS